MHYSGILVVTGPNETADCVADLEVLPGVEVHFSYPQSGRIILVQETETVEAQEEGFRRIQALPRVRMAAPHRFPGATLSTCATAPAGWARKWRAPVTTV